MSAVLEQAGVSADSGTVLALADQGYDTHHPGGSAQEPFPENATTAAALPPETTRLVHWPSIIDFLEDGLGSQVEPSATIPECKKRQLRSSSPEKTASQCKAPRLNVEQKIPTRRADVVKDSIMPRAGGGKGESTDPEATPEFGLGSGGGFSNEGSARRQSEANDSCNGIMLVKQGLLKIDAGLWKLGLSPSQIADTMDSVRSILEVKAGVSCGGEGNGRLTADEKGPQGCEKEPQAKEIPPGNPEGMNGCCGAPENEMKTVRRLVDTERLVQAACTAGKRGDVTALRVSALSSHRERTTRPTSTPTLPVAAAYHDGVKQRLVWSSYCGRQPRQIRLRGVVLRTVQ